MSEPIKPDTVLVYSGGLDSTVLLHQLISQGRLIHCLSFDYGQRHLVELDHAVEQCMKLGIEHLIVELPTQCFEGSSQTDPEIDVPEGHYEAESMKLTVVPNRNMVMLSLAVAYAISHKASLVAYAAHAGDHAIYPDCRVDFVESFKVCVAQADWNAPLIYAPYLSLTKAEVVKIGSELGVPFNTTWSCYRGEELHCGKCGTCVERREAFVLANVEDTTQYV